MKKNNLGYLFIFYILFICMRFIKLYYFIIGCGDGFEPWPSGYEPDELPDCSTPRC